MKSCVVFAVSIFDQSKIHVLQEYLDVFKTHYSDCHFYIGINHGSINEIEEIIKSYGLFATTIRIPDYLYCESDASAYQGALKILKKSGLRYDTYWFAHTKGGVNYRPKERNLYLTELFPNRFEIEFLFKQHPYIGSYALRGVSTGAAGDDWSVFNRDHVIEICTNKLTKDLPCTHVNWSYIETMYAINRPSMDAFFSITNDDFYDIKIKDRWYFETIFPWIPSRCGYFPYLKTPQCYFNNSISLKEITHKWITDNKLSHLINYLSL